MKNEKVFNIDEKKQALGFFDLRQQKRLNLVINTILNSSYKQLNLSPIPSAEGIQAINDILRRAIKEIYNNNIMADDAAIDFVYLNGNCHFYTTLVAKIYQKLGNQIHDATETTDDLPYYERPADLLYPETAKSTAQRKTAKQEKPNTIYLIGIGWEDKKNAHSPKQSYTHHQVIKLNGHYFDITGEMTPEEFKQHLQDTYQTDKIDFKYNALNLDDPFTTHFSRVVNPKLSTTALSTRRILKSKPTQTAGKN